jgi:peptide/histidine transporter 3/4
MNSLKGIGLGMIFYMISTTFVLLINVIGRAVTQEIVPCFTKWASVDPTIDISYWILLIPSVTSVIAEALTFICILQFLCSQAPSGMHGILIGLFWFIISVSIDLSSIIIIAFGLIQFPDLSKVISCSFWYLLIVGGIAMIGFALYALVAYWYVKRIRSENYNLQDTVEKYFERQLELTSQVRSISESIEIIDNSINSESIQKVD